MNTTTAELLQQMIDIKRETRTAISNKGVSVVGGMVTYPDAIRRISNIEGVDSDIDYTQIGWSDTNTTYQNAWDADYINTSIAYSKTYLDRCDAGEWELYSYTDTRGVSRNIHSPFAGDIDFVYSPYVYNLSQSLCKGLYIDCTKLRCVPQLNTSNVVDMRYMFYQCNSLVTIPQMDTSNVTSMSGMFFDCTSLTSIPQMDTSNVTNMEGAFDGCRALTSVPELDASSLEMSFYTGGGRHSPLDNAFRDCLSLVDFGGFKNLKVDLDLSDCSELSVTSLMNVINNLKELTYSERGCKLVLGETNLDKLTSSQIAIATNKGWTLT